MRVHRARHILGASPKFHRHHRFRNQMGGLRPQNVHAQQPIGLRMAEHLHQTVDLVHAVRPGVCPELVFPHAHLPELLPRRLFSQANRSQLRMGVHHPGDHVVVYVPSLARHLLDRGHPFLFRLVRQHRSGDHIPDRVDSRHAGLKIPIHRNPPSFV